MSATNRGSEIISQEFYPTPIATTLSLLPEINWDIVTSFTEPCRGEGHIYNLIPTKTKYHCELSEGSDYLKTAMPSVDLIITNPPFSLAEQFIEKALTEATCVIMLERVNFLGSQSRKAFWNTNPPTHLFVLANRPKFIAKCTNKKCNVSLSFQISDPLPVCECGKVVTPSTDATEYAWFVWDKGNIIKKEKGVYVI